MAARHILLHHLRLCSFQGFTVTTPQGHQLWCSATSSPKESNENASCGTHTRNPSVAEVDYLEGKDKEEKIVTDIQPIVTLARNILYSLRYLNEELLNMEKEIAVVENVLVHHLDYEYKIGSDLYSIMKVKRMSQIGVAGANGKKKGVTFTIDCAKPVEDKIMDIASLEKFLQVGSRLQARPVLSATPSPSHVLDAGVLAEHVNKLGEGRFGPVYKRKLNDGRKIAVKRLSHRLSQGKTQFINKAKLFAHVRHRNVVNLFRYSAHCSEKLLVYGYDSFSNNFGCNVCSWS